MKNLWTFENYNFWITLGAYSRICPWGGLNFFLYTWGGGSKNRILGQTRAQHPLGSENTVDFTGPGRLSPIALPEYVSALDILIRSIDLPTFTFDELFLKWSTYYLKVV